jgi:hypothetical protein
MPLLKAVVPDCPVGSMWAQPAGLNTVNRSQVQRAGQSKDFNGLQGPSCISPATDHNHAMRKSQGTTIMTLQQAAAASPTLSSLAERAQASRNRLMLVRSSLPQGLRAQVQSGALEDGQWCLLAPSPAAAAKLRQCVPAMLALLASHGQGVQQIRIKVTAQQG